MIVFGPVPSRRLGRSLGVNNVHAKTCSYSCIYCQLGRTPSLNVKRKRFYDPELIFSNVAERVHEAEAIGERIDYITFVPDGEPTLDLNLGVEIELLKSLGKPIAVLTNASLLWREDVRADLSEADLVSIKLDAISEELWRRINRPHKSLRINEVLRGVLEFSREFKGKLITETMLVDGLDYADELEKIADLISEMKPFKAYVAIPTRPPAEKWVKPAREEVVNRAFQILSKKLGSQTVEYLIGYEGDAFSSTGNAEEDLLSITSVHPMREEGVRELLKKSNARWKVVDNLLRDGRLIELEYEGHKYYMRSIPSRSPN